MTKQHGNNSRKSCFTVSTALFGWIQQLDTNFAALKEFQPFRLEKEKKSKKKCSSEAHSNLNDKG